MATPTITTKAEAEASGWGFQGQGSNWWAEKVVYGGKVMAVNATSAGLITGIQGIEQHHSGLKKSPMMDKGTTWNGTI